MSKDNLTSGSDKRVLEGYGRGIKAADRPAETKFAPGRTECGHAASPKGQPDSTAALKRAGGRVDG